MQDLHLQVEAEMERIRQRHLARMDAAKRDMKKELSRAFNRLLLKLLLVWFAVSLVMVAVEAAFPGSVSQYLP